jgi:hypothetical protein
MEARELESEDGEECWWNGARGRSENSLCEKTQNHWHSPEIQNIQTSKAEEIS